MSSFRCRLRSSVFAILTSWIATACHPEDDLSKLPEKPTTTGSTKQPGLVVCLFSDARMPFQRAQAQFLNLLDAQDPEHQLVMEDAQGDAGRQLAQIEALSSAPPAVLLLQPADLFVIPPSLSALKQSGTRIIIFDPPLQPKPDPQIQAIIASDPAEIGRAAAKVILKALTKRAADQGNAIPKGRIFELRGANDSTWSSQVHAGFVELLKTYPSIILVHDAPADWTSANVQLRYAEALRLQKSIDVVFAHDDFLAQAAHLAATAAGTRNDTFIIGINGFAGPEGGLEMLRRNEIDATIQRPFLVDSAWHYINHPPDSNHTLELQINPRAIVPSDLDHPSLSAPRQSKTSKGG